MILKRNITVCLEHRFYEYEGNLYTKLSFPYSYWKDYLSFFDTVTVVARAKKVDKLENDMVLVSGDNVNYEPLPYYIGLNQFIIKFIPLFFSILKIALKYKYFLLRSGNSTNILAFILILLNKPYLREYPGNIEEGVIGFAGNSLKVRILAKFLNTIARIQGKFSRANSFVSSYCQNLYGSKKPSYIFSSFKQSEVNHFKTNYSVGSKLKIITLGRLEGEKGHINLLKAIAEKNISLFEVHLIGDGGQKENLEKFAKKHNIDAKFYGSITDRDQIFTLLADSDVFVIPSLTEGMPRALLEAMAVGTPCIGSNVGGIPEVLSPENLYEANDIKTLQSLLFKMYDSEDFRQNTANKNRNIISSLYSDQVLEQKKHEFWSRIYE